MITPMSLYAAASWGLIGAGAIEAWDLYGAIHRVRGFPWNKPGEVAVAPFLVAVVLRLLLGAGMATAFVSSGQAFKDWLAKEKQAGVRVVYFTTEHSRVSSLKSELGQYRKFDVLTTPELNNKFFIARVEL